MNKVKTNTYDQKRFYSIFDLDMDEINADLDDFILKGRGCPVIVSELGPI